MQMIKDRQITTDTFEFVADDVTLNDGDIIVTLDRYLEDKPALLKHEGLLGLRLCPGDTLEEIAVDLNRFDVIELHFPDFADGRLFSTAWLLRSRHGYQGEIRATGKYLSDQLFYLSRVGVNAFKPETGESLPLVLSKLNDFSIRYQPSVN